MGIKDRVSMASPGAGSPSCKITGVGQCQSANVSKKFIIRAFKLAFGFP